MNSGGVVRRTELLLLAVAVAVAAVVAVASCAGSTVRVASRAGSTAVVCDAVWRDATRDRDVPVRIRIPGGGAKVPLVLFSHGLGGSLDAGTAWAEHWSANGLAVIHLQHAGSDAALLRGVRAGGAVDALRAGMSGVQLIERARDVTFVLDHAARLGREGQCDLSRLDHTRIGMSGHSFGAHTTQAAAGQVFRAGGPRTLGDARVRAAIAFSPAPPNAPEPVIRASFADIEIPFLSITGTRDEVPVLNDVSPEDRTLPYRYMPAGQKYLLVFEGADHAAFSGTVSGRRRSTADAHVADVVKAATLAFWRATLLDDRDARAWLNGPGLRGLLASGDRFEGK